MADCIAGWMADEANGAPILVENPDDLKARLVRRRTIRDLSGLPPHTCGPILTGLGASPAQLPAHPPGQIEIGRLIEALAPDEPDAPRTVPLHTAMERLHRMIDRVEQKPHAA